MLNFPSIEEKILKLWQEKDIFKKTLAKKSPKGIFTFYEGPPTANGKPGLHHVLARAFKDLIPRYKTMQGYFVERKAGWDTHGLPVELEVEKQIQMEESKNKKIEWKGKGDGIEEETYLKSKSKLKTSKDIIEKYGIKEFNNKCRANVWQYKEDWEKLTERIAFWLDLKNPYITYQKEYIESLWWIFKKIHERGLLYQGHKVVPQCPRCGTALSSHEVAQGYESITEPSVYLKFKVKPGQKIGDFTADENTYILSWTTTPWTLPGNVALAVGNFDYIRIIINDRGAGAPLSSQAKSRDLVVKRMSVGNETLQQAQGDTAERQRSLLSYILAKERLNIIEGDYKVEAEFKGSELVGVEYEPLFPGAIPSNVENYQNAFKVYEADFVTTSDGTGVVHTAVMYGEDDYNLGTKVGLPKHHTVDENGNFQLRYKIQDTRYKRQTNLKSQIPNEAEQLYQEIDGKFVKDKEVEQAIVKNLEERGLLLATVDYTHDYPFCWRCDSPLLYYAKNSWFIKMSALQKELIKENEKINWVPGHIKEGRFGEWLSQVKDWAISRERYWGTPLPIWVCHKCGKIKVIGSYQELYEETQCPLIKNEDFDPHRPFVDEYVIKCPRCQKKMRRIPEVADCWFDSGAMPFAQYHYPFENKKKIEAKDYYPADFIAEAIDQTRGWFYTLLAIGVLLKRGTPYKNVICLGHINDAKGQKMSKRLGNIIDPWTVINQWGADALRFHLYTINQPGESKNFDGKNVEEVVKKNFNILFNVLAFYQTYADNKKSGIRYQVSENVLDIWIMIKLNQLIIKVTESLDDYNIFGAGRSISEFINELSTWYLRRSRERFKSENSNDKTIVVNTLGHVLLSLAKLLAPFVPFIAEELYQKLGGELESVHLEDWPIFESRKSKVESRILEDMERVRKIVELALAKRDEAGIKVRQVLNQLMVFGTQELANNFVQLIKDEVNVKNVSFVKGENLRVELDTSITEELKEEGAYRELVRTINQLRKEVRLSVKDQVDIYFQTESELIKKVISNFKSDLLKSTISKNIVEAKKDSLINKDIEVNGEKVWLGLK